MSTELPRSFPEGSKLYESAKTEGIKVAKVAKSLTSMPVTKITKQEGKIKADGLQTKINSALDALGKGQKTDITELLQDLHRADKKVYHQLKLPNVKSTGDYQNSYEFLKAVALHSGKKVAESLRQTLVRDISLTKENARELLWHAAGLEEFFLSAQKFSQLPDEAQMKILNASSTRELEVLSANLSKTEKEDEGLSALKLKVGNIIKERKEAEAFINESLDALLRGDGLKQADSKYAHGLTMMTTSNSALRSGIVKNFSKLDKEKQAELYSRIEYFERSTERTSGSDRGFVIHGSIYDVLQRLEAYRPKGR